MSKFVIRKWANDDNIRNMENENIYGFFWKYIQYFFETKLSCYRFHIWFQYYFMI